MKRILAFFLLFSSLTIFAQVPYNKDELRKKSRALSSEIANLNKNLNSTKTGSKKSLLYIKNLEKKINAQNELVRVTTRERKVLEDEIYLSQLEINKLRRELGELKREYKDVLVNAYKNKSLQNKVLFVLSSKSFTEAYRRIKYLEKYSGFQGKKAEEIEEKQAAIVATVNQRKAAIADKEKILAKQQVLRENLQLQKQEQSKILEEYQNNAEEIAAQIREKQKENQQLESQIQRIIEEEIRIAREKEEAERKRREEEARRERERLAKIEAERQAKLAAERRAREEAEAKRREEANARGEEVAAITPEPAPEPEPVPEPEPSPEKGYASTSESATLGASFAASKGRLPWPVARGEVVGRFGRQPHTVLKNIYENHAGVLIGTSKGSAARTVYGGTVQAIMTISGGNKAVMVSHGDHFTVYNNLSSVFVNKGDKVSAKQEIGRVYTDSDGNTILDFQVWRGTTKQDPAGWVLGM
ncbi:peptidoglycan DD-metalloendopeptidase family protein [Flavobacteriaceae bacterium Ap0902]|nr:peptidoglycan DD-metalloendopeptidase family protein [Flavobacteriaceae bacterium Ap0902]